MYLPSVELSGSSSHPTCPLRLKLYLKDDEFGSSRNGIAHPGRKVSSLRGYQLRQQCVDFICESRDSPSTNYHIIGLICAKLPLTIYLSALRF